MFADNRGSGMIREIGTMIAIRITTMAIGIAICVFMAAAIVHPPCHPGSDRLAQSLANLVSCCKQYGNRLIQLLRSLLFSVDASGKTLAKAMLSTAACHVPDPSALICCAIGPPFVST
jgi:hypothetical protein